MKVILKGTRIIVSFLLFLFVVFLPCMSTNTISIEPDVQTWGLTNITYWNDDVTYWHYAFAAMARVPNGDIIVFYINNTHHNVYGKVHVMISHDNGTTWDDPYLFSANGPPPRGAFAVTSNNTVLYSNSYDLVVSYDNGSEGSWVDKGVYLPAGYAGQRFNLVGHTMYSCAFYASSVNTSLWKSMDNGTTWSSVSFLDNYAPSANLKQCAEWDFIAINDTHFLAICESDYGSTHPDITVQCESFDAGVTWTNFENVFSEIGEINKPALDWLNYDQGVVILTGRSYTTTDIETRWVTTDNGTTWQNNSNIDFPVPYPAFVDGCYGQAVEFLDENKILRVTYWGDYDDRNDIWTVWYGDNATYPPQNPTIQFISIDGGTNGTTTYNSTPTFNWTIVSNTSQYWLQIDNNADFSSPEVNITDINQYLYPSYYSENATRVSFTLPNPIPNYDEYYCRVKAYTKS